MNARMEQTAAELRATDRALEALARHLTTIHTLLQEEKRERYAAGENAENTFANAIDAERVANAITARLRGLGLAWVFDLASATTHRGPEWVDELTATLERLP